MDASSPAYQFFPKMGAPADFNAFLKIGDNGRITVFSGK